MGHPAQSGVAILTAALGLTSSTSAPAACWPPKAGEQIIGAPPGRAASRAHLWLHALWVQTGLKLSSWELVQAVAGVALALSESYWYFRAPGELQAGSQNSAAGSFHMALPNNACLHLVPVSHSASAPSRPQLLGLRRSPAAFQKRKVNTNICSFGFPL